MRPHWRTLLGMAAFLFLSVAMTFANSYGPQKPDDNRAPANYSSELPSIAPKSPADSLKTMQLCPGFRVELAAAEPLLASPVAVDFDEDGRLYVAEYPEYNSYAGQQPQGHGRVRLLEDSDGDGVYDKSTIFVDNLHWPSAVCCYDGGVFVCAVPDILFAKDTSGDGKADVRRVVFTGFAADKYGDTMPNSFHWGFDNRIHVQCAHGGGSVGHADRKVRKPVSVRGQGFVFDPRTESFETTSGGGGHGMSMDDWGRTFVCTSHDPMFMIMYDGRYLARNPHLEAPAAADRIAPGGYAAKIRRISPNEPWRVMRTRWRTLGLEGETPHSTEGAEPSGFFSAATGVTVYRGDAWPAEYRGHVLVGEVANNLIYRARLEPNGVGFTAQRADRDAEFLASTDTWFRPVQMANGPDGALYVMDMYRHLIESAAFIPPAIVKNIDVSGGFDKGRIYRIVPNDFRRPNPPRLGTQATAELVALLEHSNGWHRDTASRQLYQRQDRSAVMSLKNLAADSASPLGRMHALYVLDGLKALDVPTIGKALHDGDSRVRVHAVRLAEQFSSEPAIGSRFAQMIDDADLRVRFQLAFSLGAIPGDAATRALAGLAPRDADNSWLRLAILSSANGRAGELFRMLSENSAVRTSSDGRELLTKLAALIGSANRKNEIATFLQSVNSLPANENTLCAELVRKLVAKLPTSSRGQLSGSRGGKAGAILAELARGAMQTAPDAQRPVAQRVAAIHMLGLMTFAEVKVLLPDLLSFRQPIAVQEAAVATLGQFDDAGVPPLLLEAWPRLSPPLQASAVEVFLSRPEWVAAFLDAVEQGKISRGDVDPARMQVLQSHADPRFQARAKQIFASTKPAVRQDVVAAYQPALQLKGDKDRGKAVFKSACAACHQLEGVGNQIGADLNAMRDQGAATVLLNILDPNREVKPQFHSYVVVTGAGRTITGMITAETATSLTIRRADGTTETVLRLHIDELRSTGLSFMPEGLEKQIDVPAMADLLAYLKAIR